MNSPTTDAAGTVAAATTARRVQLVLRAALMRDTARLWPLLNAKNIDATFPTWLHAMTVLINNYYSQSAVAAGRAYTAVWQHTFGQTPPSGLVQLAPNPPTEWLARALGYAGPGQLTRDTTQPGTALSTTLGTASRIVLDGGRSTTIRTVHHDDKAVGWYRVTDGHPCAFCALLASRGVVYKSTTVSFQAHNDCGCTGAPAFSRSQDLPDISRRAAQVYAERGTGPALPAFRKAWDAHLASA